MRSADAGGRTVLDPRPAAWHAAASDRAAIGLAHDRHRHFFKGSGDERRLKGKSMKKAVSFCVLAALALAGCAGDLGLTENHKVLSTSTTDAAQAAALISAYRTSRGLSPVTVDLRLNEAAEYQARSWQRPESSATAASAAAWISSASRICGRESVRRLLVGRRRRHPLEGLARP